MAKQKLKRTLGCLSVVILVCILIGSGTAGILISLRQMNEPFDDSDMYVTRSEISDDVNAHLFLRKAAAVVCWDEDESDAIESMIEGVPDAPEFPSKFLDANQEALELLLQALDCEQSVFVDYENNEDLIARDHAVEAVIWADWHEIRRDSDFDRQIEFALRVIRLGNCRKTSGGPLIEYFRGQRFQNYGFAMLSDIINDDDPPVVLVENCITDIAAMQDDSQAIGDALRCEYTHAKAMIDRELGGRQWQFWVYDEDKNRRAMLREYRTLIDSADEFFRDVVVPPERGGDNSILMVLKGNALGDIMSGLVTPLMLNQYKSFAICRSQNSAVQILLALKVYHVRHYELPESLDALVPEFFDELPRDWFDGGPIKYNRDKAVVYCVGPDLTDQGGSDPDEKWGASEDPAWSISFAKAAEQPQA